MTDDRPGLLSPLEASTYLGVPRTRLYGLIGSGELRSVKIGRLRRIPRVALDEYIARVQQEQAACTGCERRSKTA